MSHVLEGLKVEGSKRVTVLMMNVATGVKMNSLDIFDMNRKPEDEHWTDLLLGPGTTFEVQTCETKLMHGLEIDMLHVKEVAGKFPWTPFMHGFSPS